MALREASDAGKLLVATAPGAPRGGGRSRRRPRIPPPPSPSSIPCVSPPSRGWVGEVLVVWMFAQKLLEVLRQDEQVVAARRSGPARGPRNVASSLKPSFSNTRFAPDCDSITSATTFSSPTSRRGGTARWRGCSPIPSDGSLSPRPIRNRSDVLHPPAEVLVQRGVRHDVGPLPGEEREDPVVVELGRPPVDHGGVRHVVLEEIRSPSGSRWKKVNSDSLSFARTA